MIIDPEIVEKIEQLLKKFDSALESHLYKVLNITDSVRGIREVLQALENAKHSPPWDDYDDWNAQYHE